MDLPQLYEAVDPDALDALVDGMSEGEVAFRYADLEVTVESDGTIRLDEPPTGDSATGMAMSDD